jgi:hypothetical protein
MGYYIGLDWWMDKNKKTGERVKKSKVLEEVNKLEVRMTELQECFP